MEWGNTEFSHLPFHVSALIAEHGRQAVYDLYLDASRNSKDTQRSHALAYLAAGIDTLPARTASEAFEKTVRDHEKNSDEYSKSFQSMANLVLSIDFKSLVFWDLLTDKHPQVLIDGMPTRPFTVFPQPAELVSKKIDELNEEASKLQGSIDTDRACMLRRKVWKYCSEELVSQAERQINVYNYFTSYDGLFATYEEREKLSTHVRFEVAPGKLHLLVEKGALYRDLESKLKRLKKIISKVRSLDAKIEESSKKYNLAKSEVEKHIPYGLAHYIDDYEGIQVAREA
ncbi:MULTISPECIES: hypothetical protein [Pseudomonas]|uniref:hypothetical protein n=1 Tax=Pseudomonas TaxID=286 RepID=UPI00398FD35D